MWLRRINILTRREAKESPAQVVEDLEQFIADLREPAPVGAVAERVTSLPEHEYKKYKGKHRDPNAGRKKRRDDPDPQVYMNLKGAQQAKEDEEREK
jgi:hypothetical protein